MLYRRPRVAQKGANITDFTDPAAVGEVPTLEREYSRNESGTLEHLLDVCQDAALGARLAAEIFDTDANLADFFDEIAAERDRFCTRLAVLLSREPSGHEIINPGTFLGKLFHWRLQLAKRIQVGYREIDDRRVNLHIIRRGADHVLHAYEQAESRRLSADAREEIHHQAERIRACNTRIHVLAAE